MFAFAFVNLLSCLLYFCFKVKADDLEIAVNGEGLLWAEIPEIELNPMRGEGPRRYTAQFTHIYVPLLYGSDADKYGITSPQIRASYFRIYLRKFQWHRGFDSKKPVKHVLMVSGGPGESGHNWVQHIYKYFQLYGRTNVIFYVADHRGVHQSTGVVELKKQNGRRSWRKVGPAERVREQQWLQNVPAFEKSVGYPVVAMSCTNAAYDLASITRVLKRYAVPKSSVHLHQFYLHAQSYGTMVALRTLQLIPSFFEAALLEGLASLELVEESVKADYGLLQACDDDPICRQRIRSPTEGLESAFDLRKLIKNISKHTRNAPCRTYLHRQLGKYLYSAPLSFSDALQTMLYELMSDDFRLKKANEQNISERYAGMLVLPFIKNLYFCTDQNRFRGQVNRLIGIIREQVRGVAAASVKVKSQHSTESTFVNAYINIHEAFDLRAMKYSSYCARTEFEDLGHQCSLYRGQVKKLQKLKELSFNSAQPSSSKIENEQLRRDVLAEDLAQTNRPVSLSELKKSSKDDDLDESSSDDEPASDSKHYKIIFENFDPHHRKRKNKKKKKSHRRSRKSNEIDKFLGVKKSKSHGQVKITPEPLTTTTRRFYYDLDHLAFTLPMTSARIYVVGGTLDIKTPSNTARRLLDSISASQKRFFEVEKVAHTTHACQGPIIQAFLQGTEISLRQADRCLHDFKEKRKLDWTFAGEDWW